MRACGIRRNPGTAGITRRAGPRAVQIAGFDPQMMADAARRNVDAGAEIIDINMGCPAKKVCNRLSGSALMKDEDLWRAFSRRRRGRVRTRDVENAHRVGPAHKNGMRIAQHRRGLRHSSTRHPRPHTHGYVFGSRRARYRPGHQGSVKIPVLANGDIDSPARAREILRYTGCDGVMIGRAAQGRPWIFDEVNFFVATGKLREDLAQENVRDIMRAHLEDLYDFYGDETGVRVARKHLSWYFRQHPGQEDFRDRLVRSRRRGSSWPRCWINTTHVRRAQHERTSLKNKNNDLQGNRMGLWSQKESQASQGPRRRRSTVAT